MSPAPTRRSLIFTPGIRIFYLQLQHDYESINKRNTILVHIKPRDPLCIYFSLYFPLPQPPPPKQTNKQTTTKIKNGYQRS